MTDTRLIERWLPIAALGVEGVRERTPMTPFPAPNRLHVWWARQPLVTSRAAILGSVLPADVNREKFIHALGIHGDPVTARLKIDAARRTGIRVKNPYDYDRAFSYTPDLTDRTWLAQAIDHKDIVVLDPAGGGGSIPLEAVRLGFKVVANDLNPVAALLMRATVEWPLRFGDQLIAEFNKIAKAFRRRLDERLGEFFPQPEAPEKFDMT